MNYTLETFYHSKEWLKFRELYLANKLAEEGELKDEETGEVILEKGKAILHHKNPLTFQNVNDPNISLNPNNIELVSFDSHQKIHNKFGCLGRVVYITQKKAEEVKLKSFDLVVDFETLKKTLGGRENTTANAWATYYNLIDQIKTRLGKWTRALVFCKAGKVEFERLKKNLGAEEI